MVRQLLVLGGLVLPWGAEPYHAACIALNAANQTAYLSDPFEEECTAGEGACRRAVLEKWTAFLRKEGIVQLPGAILRCEVFKEGSAPGETPRSRVRKWRDEEVAQAQLREPNKYRHVTSTTFGAS